MTAALPASVRTVRLTTLLPERVILIPQADGQTRSVSLHPGAQISAACGGGLLLLLAAIGLVSLLVPGGLSASQREQQHLLDRTLARLGYYEAALNAVACQVSSIHSHLLQMAAPQFQTASTGKTAAAPPAVILTASAAEACAASPSNDQQSLPASLTTAQTEDKTPDLLSSRFKILNQQIALLDDQHREFLTNSARLIASRTDMLGRVLGRLGIPATPAADEMLPEAGPLTEASRLAPARPALTGPHGPLSASAFRLEILSAAIAAPLDSVPPPLSPVAFYNAQAAEMNRLSELAVQLPMGEPMQRYKLTSGFGRRHDSRHALHGFHEGTDFGAPRGTSVAVTGGGTVQSVSWHNRYGIMVEVVHPLGYRSRYAHLSKALVKPGDVIAKGTIIGLVGMTGRSTGPHLHYEVRLNGRPLNPISFVRGGQELTLPQKRPA